MYSIDNNTEIMMGYVHVAMGEHCCAFCIIAVMRVQLAVARDRSSTGLTTVTTVMQQQRHLCDNDEITR